MKIGLTLMVALATALGLVSIAQASQGMFKVHAEIQGPAGQDWGSHALTASPGRIAWTRFTKGDDAFRLGIVLSRGSSPNCHVMGIRFEQTLSVKSSAPREKDLRLQTEACAGQSVTFDGAPLGGPKMKIALAKVK